MSSETLEKKRRYKVFPYQTGKFIVPEVEWKNFSSLRENLLLFVTHLISEHSDATS